MKSFLQCGDVAYQKYVPPWLQNLAMAHKASKLDGAVSFYTAEDVDTLASHRILIAKIKEKPLVDGVIFFTLQQLFYGGNLNIKILQFVLESGYETHFAREDLSICSEEDLDRAFPMIYSTYYLSERAEVQDYWRPVWDHISSTVGTTNSSSVLDIRDEHA